VRRTFFDDSPTSIHNLLEHCQPLVSIAHRQLDYLLRDRGFQLLDAGLDDNI
jgi:hypothetical protein